MDRIGRYRITGELGRGAMGVVYKAEDPAIGRTVAIKTIRLGDVSDDKERTFLRDRLFREARSAGILSHPNIVTIYDIQEQDDLAYVFMEYVDGPSLEKVMPKGALARDNFLKILDQTASALDYAHSRGIVHRDIKPANIMLASDGSAKITDFGVAKIVSAQATQTGVVMGTPSYMSPEQITDRGLDGRSDQFSLAIIAYQLLTGEKPFSAPTLPSLMYKIVHEQPAPPQRLNPSLSPAVEMVLRRGMEKNPEARYPNCSQLVKALMTACESRAGWTPMAQGGAESLETVAESLAATAKPASEPAADAPKAAQPADPPAAPAKPAKPPIKLPDTISTPRIEPTDGGIPVRKGGWLGPGVALALGACLIGGLGWVGYRMLLSDDRAGREKSPSTEARPPEPPPKPSAVVPGSSPKAPQTTEPAKGASVPKPEAGAAQGQKSPAFREVEVRIATTPPGAKISVDGGEGCTSPCERVMSAGRHTLVANLEGYRTSSRAVSVPDELEVQMNLEATSGTLFITSTPAGGTIVVDGKTRTEKTPARIALPAGKHKVRVDIEGAPSDEREVEVMDGSLSQLTFRSN